MIKFCRREEKLRSSGEKNRHRRVKEIDETKGTCHHASFASNSEKKRKCDQ
jgi:hypothetical protein